MSPLKKRKGVIRLADRTPPIKAIHTPEGIICCKCHGAPQPKENFPRQKGIPGSTCKSCLNKIAKARREAKKNDFF